MARKTETKLAHAPQHVKIIGGQWRGTKLPVMLKPHLRPTASRTRETLFNWLQASIAGSLCLDMFAGSGVLGFEAVSRGARAATLIDNDAQVVAQLRQQAARLNTEAITIMHMNAVQYLSQTQLQYDTIFIDPPFHNHDLAQLLEQLIKSPCLKRNTQIYLEAPSGSLPQQLPVGLDWRRQSQAGAVEYGLLST